MISIVLPLALLQTVATPAPATTPPPPPACDTEADAGFDFWVGEWDVFPNGQPERQVARSRIERKHNGCAVIENWMPLSGQGGTSLNHRNPITGQWHQKWVGSSPGAVEFTGGVHEGKMVLTGNWPTPQTPQAMIRMTYTANEDGSVRQHGEQSLDHGLTWGPSFDFIYRPRADGEAEEDTE